jgi:hypothetical protein
VIFPPPAVFHFFWIYVIASVIFPPSLFGYPLWLVEQSFHDYVSEILQQKS